MRNGYRVAGGLTLLLLVIVWMRSRGGEPRCDLSTYDAATTEALDLKRCGLDALPATIIAFQRLKKLDLGFNSLSSLPRLPESLEIVFLLSNAFEAVPPQVSPLPNLRMLSFKSNRLRSVGVPLPTSLKWLILTDNHLAELPHQLGELTLMRKLMLANNRLSSLPRSMASMRELELLRLANNRLRRLPEWLHALPRLTWLAVAGNPCVSPAPPRASLLPVAWEELSLGERLGEGTSGIVHKASWKGQTVAVKLYKSELSSDGRSLDEVFASCAVEHPHVLKFLGYFERPKLGAVLEWAPGLRSLGKPPSMETITRDTYGATASFGGRVIRAVASSIAAALAHLHSRGVAHGDCYAHNILFEPTSGEAKLSDFGAAFYYGRDSPHARGYERMEGRALGFLLQELLARHDGSDAVFLPPVREVAAACAAPGNETPAQHPCQTIADAERHLAT